MSVPTQRRTSSSRKRRASHHALGRKTLFACPKCKKAIMPHRACSFCGHYRGRDDAASPARAVALKPKDKKAAKERKKEDSPSPRASAGEEKQKDN